MITIYRDSPCLGRQKLERNVATMWVKLVTLWLSVKRREQPQTLKQNNDTIVIVYWLLVWLQFRGHAMHWNTFNDEYVKIPHVIGIKTPRIHRNTESVSQQRLAHTCFTLPIREQKGTY